MLQRVKESEQLWGDLEGVVASKHLNERTVAGLFDAAMGFRVRNATYRAIAQAEDDEISEATASRDLRQLVDAGWLEPNREKRGRFYTATNDVRVLRLKIIQSRDPRDDSDPFVGLPGPTEPRQLFAL